MTRPSHRGLLTTALILMIAGLLAFAWPTTDARAQGTGRLAGRVTDARTGEGISGVAVQIPALRRGTQTGEDGRFILDLISPGSYAVKLSHIGFVAQTRDGVVVVAGKDTRVDAKLKSDVLRGQQVDVSGKRPLVEVKVPTSQHTMLAEDIKNVALQNVGDLIRKQAGVVVQDNEVHIRGGRSDEVVYYTEGVREKDALTGKPLQSALSPRALQEVNIISGGFEAEYGDALSGVIQLTMKEGNPHRYIGALTYTTDHGPVGDNNTDQFDVQLGGPEPITSKLLPALGLHLAGEKTFYLNAGAELGDGYLPGINDIPGAPRLRSGYTDRLFGQSFSYGNFFAPRADNTWRFAANATWTPRPERKFKFYQSKRVQINQGFGDAAVGDLTRLSTNYPWRWHYALERYTTQLHDDNTTSLTWRETFGLKSYQELRVSRTFTGEQRDVNAAYWYRYQQGFIDDQDLSQQIKDLQRGRYFYFGGDTTSEGPDWRNRYLSAWNVDYKYTRKSVHNKIDVGTTVAFQDAQWARVNCPCDSTSNAYGRDYDVFHVYPTNGNTFLQNHFDYQGLSGYFGTGFLFWMPGALADRVLADSTRTDIIRSVHDAYFATTKNFFGHRVKTRWTPRFAVAYPISDRTKFYFNYGRYAQWPTYYYVYTRINPSRTGQFPQKGNPALNPSLSVNYEVGSEHQFSSEMAFKIAVYNKDLYDYLASRVINVTPSYVQFYNQDYARARGVETELRRRRADYWSGAITYTYSQATGKGSDPNEILIARESGATDFGEGQPREVNLYWNRPHSFTFNLDYRVEKNEERPRLLGMRLPRQWGVNVFGTLQSGLSYTPQANCGRSNCAETAPEFSKNGPFENRWDMRADKSWELSNGRSLRMTLEVYNLLNSRTARRIDPRTGQGYVIGQGTAGVDPHSPQTIGTYSDPSLFDAPRTGRVGLEWAW